MINELPMSKIVAEGIEARPVPLYHLEHKGGGKYEMDIPAGGEIIQVPLPIIPESVTVDGDWDPNLLPRLTVKLNVNADSSSVVLLGDFGPLDDEGRMQRQELRTKFWTKVNVNVEEAPPEIPHFPEKKFFRVLVVFPEDMLCVEGPINVGVDDAYKVAGACTPSDILARGKRYPNEQLIDRGSATVGQFSSVMKSLKVTIPGIGLEVS